MLEQYWEERIHKEKDINEQQQQQQQQSEGKVEIPKVKVCLDMACGFEVFGLHLGANRRLNFHNRLYWQPNSNLFGN